MPPERALAGQFHDEQDYFDRLKKRVSSLKEISISIEHEIEEQHQLLDEVSGIAERSKDRLRESMRLLYSLAKNRPLPVLFIFSIILSAVFLVLFCCFRQ